MMAEFEERVPEREAWEWSMCFALMTSVIFDHNLALTISLHVTSYVRVWRKGAGEGGLECALCADDLCHLWPQHCTYCFTAHNQLWQSLKERYQKGRPEVCSLPWWHLSPFTTNLYLLFCYTVTNHGRVWRKGLPWQTCTYCFSALFITTSNWERSGARPIQCKMRM